MTDYSQYPPPDLVNGRRNPGLYPDPGNPNQRRWWNGQKWTEHTGPHTKPTEPINWTQEATLLGIMAFPESWIPWD